MAQSVLKPVYFVESLGEYAVAPDGAILNIGGTSGPNFTVGGKPILFADGTTSDGTNGHWFEMFKEHLRVGGIRHSADQISINTSNLAPITGANVQDAFMSLRNILLNMNGTGGGHLFARGYEHVQAEGNVVWRIIHNAKTKKVQVTIWDELDEQLFPDLIKIEDDDTILVSFNSPVAGRAIVMLF